MTHVRRRHLWKVAATIKRQEGFSTSPTPESSTPRTVSHHSQENLYTEKEASHSGRGNNNSMKEELSTPTVSPQHKVRKTDGLSELDDYDPDWDTQFKSNQIQTPKVKAHKNNIITNAGNDNGFHRPFSNNELVEKHMSHTLRRPSIREHEDSPSLRKGKLASLPDDALDRSDLSLPARVTAVETHTALAESISQPVFVCDSQALDEVLAREGCLEERSEGMFSGEMSYREEGEEDEEELMRDSTLRNAHVTLYAHHNNDSGAHKQSVVSNARLSYVNTSIDNKGFLDSMTSPIMGMADVELNDTTDAVALDYYDGDIMNDMCELETEEGSNHGHFSPH